MQRDTLDGVDYIVSGNSTHADQLVRQLAHQFRGTPGHDRQHEPSPVPDRIFDPAWKYAAATGSTGLHVVAGLQGIAGADESTATPPQFEASIAGGMQLASDRSIRSSVEAGCFLYGRCRRFPGRDREGYRRANRERPRNGGRIPHNRGATL